MSDMTGTNWSSVNQDDDSGEIMLTAPPNPLADMANTPWGTTAMIPNLSCITEADRECNAGYTPQGVPTGAPAPARFIPRQAD